MNQELETGNMITNCKYARVELLELEVKSDERAKCLILYLTFTFPPKTGK